MKMKFKMFLSSCKRLEILYEKGSLFLQLMCNDLIPVLFLAVHMGWWTLF